VCTVCSKSPASFRCNECEDQFCQSCFKVFHSKGRKRQHKPTGILEQLEAGQNFCELCHRRAGTEACTTCSRTFCDSCYECSHKADCATEHARLAVLDSKHLRECAACGKPADSICTTCGDYFCTLSWMGNPGCFAQTHSKGKRAAHYQLHFSDIEDDEDPIAAAARVRERMERDAKQDLQRAVTQLA